MWRKANSLSHFTQLASSKSNYYSHLQPLSLQIPDVDHAYRSTIRSSSSTAVTSSPGLTKLGISGIDRVRSIASSTGVAYATSFRAREVVDAFRHYGQCYWELSKAKLRHSTRAAAPSCTTPPNSPDLIHFQNLFVDSPSAPTSLVKELCHY